ncbi:hypothetical protein BASA50_005658 [Batrachochytrium salamandrivorans]|uniref:Dipeptidyl-peptidase IV n=1 Tax=Batrachochytrium salamandrivorans TaxID=1357716 RepID=A0ABQ8FFD8_9FUNG|nr:hypothetical protein BASA60_011492 [Batrachochytrium salamandrivorans]KAH6584606.1 hypothetical protein BASA61_007352 [Batrachochytrium salamandrivorans]KAH6595702.1 hypothetical protein BASA50_005658 [Batrachochytrium salamandrivorans]
MADLYISPGRPSMTAESEDPDKLPHFGEEDSMLEEGRSFRGSSSETVARNRRDSRHTPKGLRNQRTSILLLRAPLLLFLILIIVLVSIVFLALQTDGEGSSKGKSGGNIPSTSFNGRPIASMEQLLDAGNSSPLDASTLRWLKNGAGGFLDGSYLVFHDGEFLVSMLDQSNKTVIAQSADIRNDKNEVIKFKEWSVSTDLKYLLLTTNYEKGWRHSFFGDYWLYDLEKNQTKPLVNSTPTKIYEDELGSGKVALTVWSPTGHSVAWVRDNDLYATVDRDTEVRITTDGSKNIINGISDWVYEEEVLGNGNALWFSPDGSHIAFIKFNDTLVKTYPLEYYAKYGATAYPKELNIKYPKPGSPNPVATLHMSTLSSPNITGHDVQIDFGYQGFADDDRLIVEVNWVTHNDTMLVRLMNRVQDIQRVFMVKGVELNGIVTWNTTLVRDEATPDGAWHNNLQPLVPVLGNSDSSYIEIMDNADGFAHLALFSHADQSTPTSWITSGPWEVTAVSGQDSVKGIIYFISTEQGSTQRHLYSVHLDGSSKTRLTPPAEIDVPKVISFVNETGGLPLGDDGFFTVTFSPQCTYSIIVYNGPDVPYTSKFKIESTGWVKLGVLYNDAYRSAISEFAIPQTRYFTIPNAIGDVMNAKMTVPADFDLYGQKTYPVLMQVYGGPNSQMVQQKFNIDFSFRMATLGFIVVQVDGRGTGFKGRKYRSSVSRNLGLHEVEDQTEAARWLGKQSYVDASRIGIWGWSYGGYMAAKCIEANSGVFALGMSVAPVTDWRFYDSVYTERYMKTPARNVDGYNKSAVVDMSGFANSKFLLVHGTADDNVHFQNSALLVWRLTGANISHSNLRVQYYTDSDHSINDNGANPRVFNLLMSYACDAYKMDCTRNATISASI